MNTNKILSILFALVLLVGCDYNDKYFDGYDDGGLTDVKSIDYELTNEDYATIAGNATNKALADAAGVRTELDNLAKTRRFSETLEASVYIPAFIKSKWFTADPGSAARVTYSDGSTLPEYVFDLNSAGMYKVTNDDYKTVWGEESSTNFFTPLTQASIHIPGILATAFPDAESGDIIAVDYNQSENEPAGSVVAVNEDFNVITGSVSIAEIEDWQNVITAGTNAWAGRAYSGNGYIQASANNHTAGRMEAYMISPVIKVTSGLNLTFDACYGFYKQEGGRLSVFVSSDLAGFTPEAINAATWDDITSSFSIEIPPSGTNYGTLAPAGQYSLDGYIGENIYIALRYNGDGTTAATTTVQIDNVVVKSESIGTGGDVYTATTGLFSYNGTAWSTYSGNGYMITKTDYTSMGLNYDNFSGTQADHYLPTFLNLKFPYAQEGDTKAPTYKYYASSVTSINADEYIYTEGQWMKNNAMITSQFVLSPENVWNYDPSITIILNPGRNIDESIPYFRTIVNYVAENYGEGYYQTGYSNAEYYYGSGYYNNNFDFRVSAWRTASITGQTAYADLSDADLEKLMRERLPEAFIPALKAFHSDMIPLANLDVFCTIRFGIYTGSTISSPTHEIKYKVVGAGEFEYVEDSFQAL